MNANASRVEKRDKKMISHFKKSHFPAGMPQKHPTVFNGYPDTEGHGEAGRMRVNYFIFF